MKKEKSLWSYVEYAFPVCSFILWLVGMIGDYKESAWLSRPEIRLCYYVVAFFPVGFPVLLHAVRLMWKKDFFNEFLLMSLSSIGAFAIGEYPEAVGIMLFYIIGETLQHEAVEKSSEEIESLLDLRPKRVRLLLSDHTYRDVEPAEVKEGEVIEVASGEMVSLDGCLMEEQAWLDTAALSGESFPRSLSKGEEVLAGMVVLEQVVHLKVVRPYEYSALERILKLVKESASHKAPTELFIRRFARVYTPIVFLLALLIVFLPMGYALFSSFDYVFAHWLYRGLVFLVVSCPCALVISVPLGYFSGIGAAARRGILFKGSNYLDGIVQIDAMAFDKTGTLTTGNFEVSKIDVAGGSLQSLLDILYSVEQKSIHPIAQAISRYAQECGARPLSVSSVCEVPGLGMEAWVEGKKVLVGSLQLMKKEKVLFPDEGDNEKQTVVMCALEGSYLGKVSLEDQLKENVVELISGLKGIGVSDICLFSGDRDSKVQEVARRVGISQAYGDLLPQDKVNKMRLLMASSKHKVAFVGEGMNDAPVLSLSDVGIAMGGLGSDAAVESANVIIQNDDLSQIVVAIRIARATRRIVLQNILGAIGVKMGILLAGAFGLVTLWGAVFADVGVALLAVFNSLRIFYKKY